MGAEPFVKWVSGTLVDAGLIRERACEVYELEDISSPIRH
jgi:hypothetical protein